MIPLASSAAYLVFELTSALPPCEIFHSRFLSSEHTCQSVCGDFIADLCWDLDTDVAFVDLLNSSSSKKRWSGSVDALLKMQ